jgi:hypothetical protein
MEAQKSKASSRLRRALKWRTRRYRRRQVFWFYLFMLLGAIRTLGGDHHRRRELEWALLLPAICALTALKDWSRRSYSRWRCVSSLDDRAQVAHGLNFEQLSAAEQKEILRRYQVGGRLLDETLDERQAAASLQANAAAFRFLRPVLLWFAAGYWVVWLWMPAGGWRDMLTDNPVIISWLVVFVISLPQVIEMWTEPDEMVSEPRLTEANR